MPVRRVLLLLKSKNFKLGMVIEMTFEISAQRHMKLSNRAGRNILIILNMLVPAVVITYILLSNGKSLTEFIPRWNDEVCWWQQANAVSAYGRPLGYWGYNGGKPIIGTFAAWGPAAVLPYGLFGFIFGWNLHSYIYANIVLMSIAIFLFICLTNMDSQKVLILLIVNILQIVRNCYLLTAMAETARYSMGLVAIGIIYWLFKHEKCNRVIKYILIPGYLLYISQAYLILTICIFGYIYCILKDFPIWKRIGGVLQEWYCVQLFLIRLCYCFPHHMWME